MLSLKCFFLVFFLSIHVQVGRGEEKKNTGRIVYPAFDFEVVFTLIDFRFRIEIMTPLVTTNVTLVFQQ